MHSFAELLQKNLPVCVRVCDPDDLTPTWGQQLILFGLLTSVCLSGSTAFTYYTHRLGWHHMPVLAWQDNPNFVLFCLALFGVSLLCLMIWLPSLQSHRTKPPAQNTEDLNYVFPQSHALHIGPQAWDLADAHSIVIDYPQQVTVHFKYPLKTFVLLDDRSGWPTEFTPKQQRQLERNSALFVYFTGVELPSRYVPLINWWWNLGAGVVFGLSTMLPFFFQAVGLQLYWVGFLAIPVSYLLFKVGQKEFPRQQIFSYAQFLADHQAKLNPQLYRPPLV